MNLTPQEEAERLIEQYYNSTHNLYVSTQCAIQDVQNTIDVLREYADDSKPIAVEWLYRKKVLTILKDKLK